jgi:hypothetical protein
MAVDPKELETTEDLPGRIRSLIAEVQRDYHGHEEEAAIKGTSPPWKAVFQYYEPDAQINYVGDLDQMVYVGGPWVIKKSTTRAPASKKTREIFEQCVQEWRRATRFESSSTEIFMNPAYQRIIGLGPDVIPLILRSLAERHEHWFWALRALTGENPVSEANAGDVEAMSQAWLTWGREHGYID